MKTKIINKINKINNVAQTLLYRAYMNLQGDRFQAQGDFKLLTYFNAFFYMEEIFLK
jgi:hypothetical protein